MKIKEELLLLECLSSKLCHDLAGTIGGITNSIEFLNNENNDLKAHAESLLKSSSKQLVDQFEFFRKLYGYIDESQEGVFYNLLEFTKNYLLHNKIQLAYNHKIIIDLNSNIKVLEAKAIINIIFLLSKCLIRGGEIELEISKNYILMFNLKGQNLKFHSLIEEIANNNEVKIDLSTVTAQAVYTIKLIHLAKLKFDLHSKELNEIKFKLTKF